MNCDFDVESLWTFFIILWVIVSYVGRIAKRMKGTSPSAPEPSPEPPARQRTVAPRPVEPAPQAPPVERSERPPIFDSALLRETLEELGLVPETEMDEEQWQEDTPPASPPVEPLQQESTEEIPWAFVPERTPVFLEVASAPDIAAISPSEIRQAVMLDAVFSPRGRW